MAIAITHAPPSKEIGVSHAVDHALVSIIIPTLNEVQNVLSLINKLSRLPEVEVIFSDGGSSDGTRSEIEFYSRARSNVHLIHAPRCRSQQMNAAAKRAKGEWLIFLHADTELPAESFHAFLRTVKKHPRLNSGAFTFRVANKRWVYRYLEFYVGLRCKLLKLPFGDQAIFVKRAFFEEVGGYREDFPLMEDMELIQRLNKQKGFSVLKFPVYTSARRFETDGYLRRSCGNLYLQVLYKLGVHPKKLAKRYWK